MEILSFLDFFVETRITERTSIWFYFCNISIVTLHLFWQHPVEWCTCWPPKNKKIASGIHLTQTKHANRRKHMFPTTALSVSGSSGSESGGLNLSQKLPVHSYVIHSYDAIVGNRCQQLLISHARQCSTSHCAFKTAPPSAELVFSAFTPLISKIYRVCRLCQFASIWCKFFNNLYTVEKISS